MELRPCKVRREQTIHIILSYYNNSSEMKAVDKIARRIGRMVETKIYTEIVVEI
jgi:hypothetical protein